MLDPVSVVVRFNDRINGLDLAGLASLMSDDHTFIDADGGVVAGKQACVEAWRGFFAAFPDYRNVFTLVAAHSESVTIVGHSVCSDSRLAGPALWRAVVREGQVAQWRVAELAAHRAELAARIRELTAPDAAG